MNWYVSEDTKRSMRQVVLEIPVEAERKTKFGQLVLGARFMELMEQTWLTGFFQLDDDPGPYLLVRADGATAELRGCAIRVAFSFFRMRASGLLAIYVSADSPTLETREHPHVVFEMVYGLDQPHTTKLLGDVIDRDSLHICVAEGQGTVKYLPGGIYTAKPIIAQYDVVVALPADCHARLRQEFEALVRYHGSLSPTNRNFGEGTRQWMSENPQNENPVLPRGVPDSTATGKERRHGERRWWRFWM